LEAEEEAEGDEAGVLACRSELFRRALPPEPIAALLDHLAPERAPGESRGLNFMPLGGAYNRVPVDATAFAHRGERFLLEHVAVAGPGASRDAAARWAAESRALAHPWGSGRVYPNFPDPDLEGWPEAYHGENLERLRRVKRRYDPDRLLRFPQGL
jgi:FAD/FMN-containing dehydrogenase